MIEDVAVLLEWLNANGITEFFNEVPFLESNDDIIETNKKKNFDETIKQLVTKQSNIDVTHIYKLDYVQKSKNVCDNLNSIESILKTIQNFDGFTNIKNTATSTIFYQGNLKSDILIINDFPNEKDDISGKVFSDDVEELMTKMLKAIDINYNDCCFVNSFFWRLAGNRIPIKEEFELCKPFVEKFISFLEPKLVIFTGNYSLSNLTNYLNTVVKTHGKFFDYTNEYMYKNISATSIFGPNFLIKNQSKKRETWNDLLMIKEFLNS